MINQTQKESYKKEFLPLYNSEKFKEAEEIARKKDLGMLLNEEQLGFMAFIVAHKNKDQLQNVLFCVDTDYGSCEDRINFAVNSYEESMNRGDYWIKIVEARKK
jgi:hypothetical protein